MRREFESKFRECVGARNTENPLLTGAMERTLGPGGPGLGICPWGAGLAKNSRRTGALGMEDKVGASVRAGAQSETRTQPSSVGVARTQEGQKPTHCETHAAP